MLAGFKIIIISLLFQLFINNLNVYGQVGLRLSAGLSDIAFLKEGQEIFLGYETNYLIHNVPSFSFQSGAILQIKTNGRFIPRAEVLISREGLNYSSRFLYDDIRYLIRITYLKVPILLKIDPNLKNNRQSGFMIGPYLSYKLKSTLFTEIHGT
ncbi:MAG: outer membrane beta-barrel protein, partial [Bacteroidales bacterium]